MTTLNDSLVSDLAARATGSVVAPGDADYDEARAIYNGLIDRRPALIVRAETTDDVVAALAFASNSELEVSVRGGGHNVAGRSVADGGLMISLADMRKVTVDLERSTATAQGGATWADLNTAAGEHGLAVTGGLISATGIAGYTLGGGLGWLMAGKLKGVMPAHTPSAWSREAPPECSSGRTSGLHRSHRRPGARVAS